MPSGEARPHSTSSHRHLLTSPRRHPSIQWDPRAVPPPRAGDGLFPGQQGNAWFLTGLSPTRSRASWEDVGNQMPRQHRALQMDSEL